MTFLDDNKIGNFKISKAGFQILTCGKCGHKQSEAIDSKLPNGEYKTPWDIWPNGCPKCGYTKCDVEMIF